MAESDWTSFDLWLKGLNGKTAEVYGQNLKRLFRTAGVTPQQAVSSVINGPNGFDPQAYMSLVQQANNFSEHRRALSIYALRRYLYDHGVLMLPPTRMRKPARKRPPTRMSWEQAHAIAAAASRPYNMIFKLMLESGWGIGEFLKFNTAENWEHLKQFLAKNDRAEYYRHDFTSRKHNAEPFYTLVPTATLKDILAIAEEVPIKASRGAVRKLKGVILNTEQYHRSTLYLESAWRTAKKRAPTQLMGSPTVHELRDTFRTRATQANCAPEAAEFAMGHSIDPLGYNKCFYDEKWMWTELRKISAPQENIDESTFQERLKEYVDIHFKELVDERFNELVRQRQLE